MEQMTLFECCYEKYKITKPIRLIELFAGYGSQALALKYLGVKFEHWRICEWATKSIQAYNDLHIRDYTDYSKDLTQAEVIDKLASYGVSMNYNEPMTYEQIKRKGEDWQRKTYNNIIATHNLVNIQNAKAIDFNIVDTDKYEYILTYSFPCQDLSLAGKGKGMSRDSGTRSGMLWEVERILDECKEKGNLPQILVMENVSQVIGANNIKDFQEWVFKLESLGYSNYVEVLNSKNYYIPQHRERCFMVSILGEYNYKMPRKMQLKYKLEDLLEHYVSENYYLSDKMINYISSNGSKNFKNPDCKINLDIARPLTTDPNKRAGTTNYISSELPKNYDLLEVKRIFGVFDKDDKKHQAGSVYDKKGLAPTLDTAQGGWRQPCIIMPEATQKGYVEAHEGDGVYINRPHQKRGVVQKGMIQTLKTSPDVGVVVKNEELKIRKLTPKEYFRLMGVKDNDFNNVASNQSNSSLYHLAGDSIVTTCLMGLLGELLEIDYTTKINELVEELKENHNFKIAS